MSASLLAAAPLLRNRRSGVGASLRLLGLSWQITPSVLGEMLQDRDDEKARRVMEAMFKMDKIDIRRLQQAYAGQ
jgi:hypothetical protein